MIAARIGTGGHLALRDWRLEWLTTDSDSARVLASWKARALDDSLVCTPDLEAPGWQPTPIDQRLREHIAAAAAISMAEGLMDQVRDLDMVAALLEASARFTTRPIDSSHLFKFSARQTLSGPFACTLSCAGSVVIDPEWKLKLELFPSQDELKSCSELLDASDTEAQFAIDRLVVIHKKAPPELAEPIESAFQTTWAPYAFLWRDRGKAPLPASCLFSLIGIFHAIQFVEEKRVKSAEVLFAHGDRSIETAIEIDEYSLLK